MWYRSAINFLTSGASRTLSRINGDHLRGHRATSRRLQLEPLESRCVLSTFAVTSISDSGAGSLRAAIVAANANPGPDTIGFATTGTIALTSGQLTITDSLTISGPGENALTVSGENLSRIFALLGNPTVVIADLTIANGRTVGSPGGGISMAGGTLTLARCTLFGNSAVGVDGTSSYPVQGGEGAGGGIYVAGGSLTLDHVTVAGNQAVGGLGWGGYAEPYGYTGGHGSGGGLYVAGGAVKISHSTISGNYATGGSGGDSDQQYWVGWLDTYGGNGGNAAGGGIVVTGGTLAVNQSTLIGNEASGGMGGAGVYHGWPGEGVGGGIHTPADPPITYLDSFTVNNTNNNSPSNVVGTYYLDGTPPLPNLAVGDVTVIEANGGTAVFTVTLSAPSSQPVTVAYATVNGTAAAGSDYQTVSGTLMIPTGQTTGSITVLMRDDRLTEPVETFVVNLSSPTGATIADGQGLGSIVDNEPGISISDVSKAEGKKGQSTLFTFTVTLSAAYDQPVTISYRTVDGTATTGNSDYVAKTGTLTFAPGETTKTISIAVKGDSKREADEVFYLDLFANSSNSHFNKSRGIGTILNDD